MTSNRSHFTGAAIAAIFCAIAGAAVAMDNEAGVPLDPRDAAGAWTIESQGRAVCVVRLSASKSAAGYGFRGSPDCGDAIPAGAAGWTPTHDGMAITSAEGESLVAFSRWSNSLFVSHRASGVDIQLKRGTPGAMPSKD